MARIDLIGVGVMGQGIGENDGDRATFFASPESGFITGEIIDINGGLHLD